ncbi:hypothetical protein LPJ73_001368 [Coemansia sp. RSA 2703]|nr:hypothetical protein LPJ73_001368 [Coemansia sp. RSA 2703]
MSSHPVKESEKSGAPSKLAGGAAAASSAPEGKQGERVEPVPTHREGAGEGQREFGKVVTVERMQKMERRLDDVCALLEALVTGRRVGESAGHVEYTPSPGGVSSRFEYQEQPLYGTPGTAVERAWQSEDRSGEKTRSNNSNRQWA